MKSKAIALAVVWGLSTAACVKNNAETSTSFVPRTSTEIAMEVQNQTFYPATIYAFRGGSRFRLGIVESEQSEDFQFSWAQSDLQVQIDFLAVGCIFTDRMPVMVGDEILLIIQPQDYRKASQDFCRR
ncbi:MAG: hypothetical protein OEY63_00225 [Gemmatimonadota bacterium]|nr:hypothetical protein [Gemmatimonadota bacterium]MDH5805892.1 hypothetical protein [Gemmatimonadota bacterium]